MKIILCGGGTVGHISPANAIGEAIKSYDKDADLLFIGRENGEENYAINKNNFSIKTIKVYGIQRKCTFKNLKHIFYDIKAIRTAIKIITEFSPDLVFGTGGYVSWPVVYAAQLKKIPTMIHESNFIPGMVTKNLSPKCTRVLLNFPGSQKNLKKQTNTRIVGNPIRSDFFKAKKQVARDILGVRSSDIFILSLGGSGGSQKLNDVIIEVMKDYSTRKENICHIHSCGRKYYDNINEKYPYLTNIKSKSHIKAYLDNISTYIAAADIVISRCGAMTISELSAMGKCTILIPSPNVTNNHQYHNAKLLSDNDAALMIEEQELTKKALIDNINAIISDVKRQELMKRRIQAYHTKNSNQLILKEIVDILNK